MYRVYVSSPAGTLLKVLLSTTALKPFFELFVSKQPLQDTAKMALQNKTLSKSCVARGSAFGVCRPTVKPSRRPAVSVRAEGEAAAPPAAAGLEKSMSYFKPVLDIEAIKGVLPHRLVSI